MLSAGVALLAAVALAPADRAVLFGGDFKAWLDGAGSATPALALLIWPVAMMAVWLAQRALIADWSDRRLGARCRHRWGR